MFKNKHVIVAMIVAPILAILAWFATGMLVDEQPHVMQKGAVYTLNVKSNCRWESGNCTLENEDLSINFKGKYTSHTLELTATSTVNLSEIKIAYDKNDKPQNMVFDKNKNVWATVLDLKHKSQFINAIFVLNETVFYAQLPTVFLNPKDREFEFEKDFQKK